MVFEGLVIHKVPYKERDLIVKLILRSGHVGSFYIYGGQGGGKHHKPSVFDLGSMMKIMVKEQKSQKVETTDLMVAQEYSRIWEAQHMRHHIQAYYLACLYFEIIQKFIQPFQMKDAEYLTDDNEGIFSVVSNALFYMNDALEKKQFVAEQHLNLFMVKLLFHLGIMPATDNCTYCNSDLLETIGVTFLPANGQFACLNCVTAENEKGLWLRMKKGYQTPYKEYIQLTGATFQEGDKLIQYFCHQFHLRPVELKTYSLLLR